MKMIPVNETAWTSTPAAQDQTSQAVTFVKRGDTYRFMLDGRSDVIEATAVNGALQLFPERSSAHKVLQDALTTVHSDAADAVEAAGPKVVKIA